MRELAKALLRGAATVVVLPSLLSWWLRSLVLGRDRALLNSTQAWALVPGHLGQYLRRAFLMRTLAYCHKSATVEWGATFSQAGTRIEENVYIGPHCHIGLAHIERNALLAAGVHVPSGPETHGMLDPTVPIREQPGELRVVRIGAGTWVGSAAVILADVGRDSVIGASAVVTKPVPDRVVAVGVPAKVAQTREPAPANGLRVS